MYCLVVTDVYSRFTWVFFLSTKDETSGILKSFITRIENLVDHKCSVARTSQQNRVTKRRNRTLIEAARTMLADSKLPTTFWSEAFSTACYVQNRVLVVKPHNKTPYEFFHGRKPMLSFIRPFGYPVTILNTIDHLGKFDGKTDKGFFVGYSLNSKAFRVFNRRTKIIEETLNIRFSENTPNNVGTKDNNNVVQARKEKEPGKDYILLPLWTADPPYPQEPKSSQDARFKPSNDVRKKVNEVPRQENKCKDQEEKDSVNSTNRVNKIKH
nr:retrovirus-related Pol polyprotein from transposon TNT 1-94 [Tanacetum cinerariifolium]